MESKISRYRIELRSKLLKLSDKELLTATLGIDWEEQGKQLKKIMRPVMLEAVEFGIQLGKSNLKNINPTPDSFNQRVTSYLEVRMNRLTGINNTIKNRVESKLRTALDEQIQAGASLTEQVEALRESIRNYFNLTANQARLIARTESAGAVNGGSVLYYESEGVNKKEWVTAHDEFVRESHRACEHQGAIPMTNAFVNGLQFPADQANGDAGEVCNCRCSLLPVAE